MQKYSLICFESIQIFREIASFSFQVSWGHQFLTEVKKFFDLGIFRLGLSNFWIGTWFPFDVFQFITYVMAEFFTAWHSHKTKHFWNNLMKTRSPFNNAYFGNFCIYVGQRLEQHWVLEDSMKITFLTLSKQNLSNRQIVSDLHICWGNLPLFIKRALLNKRRIYYLIDNH